MTAATGAPVVLDLSPIISALTDAIEYRKDRFAVCGDCEKSVTGICPDHTGDDERAQAYETALAALQAGTETR